MQVHLAHVIGPYCRRICTVLIAAGSIRLIHDFILSNILLTCLAAACARPGWAAAAAKLAERSCLKADDLGDNDCTQRLEQFTLLRFAAKGIFSCLLVLKSNADNQSNWSQLLRLSVLQWHPPQALFWSRWTPSKPDWGSPQALFWSRWTQSALFGVPCSSPCQGMQWPLQL
jgi:hypothetical protein